MVGLVEIARGGWIDRLRGRVAMMIAKNGFVGMREIQPETGEAKLLEP